MQHIQKKITENCITGLMAAAWVAGLLTAGSDSPYMPWLNGMGLFLFFGASLLLGKRLNPSKLNNRSMMKQERYQKPDSVLRSYRGNTRRLNISYALEQ